MKNDKIYELQKRTLMESEIHWEIHVNRARVFRGLTVYPRKSIKAEVKS